MTKNELDGRGLEAVDIASILAGESPQGLSPEEKLVWILGDLMNAVENYFGCENPKRLGDIYAAATRILDEVSLLSSSTVAVTDEQVKDGSRPLPFDRDQMGRFVREAWVRWAKTQPSPKPSWLLPYDDLSEADKEADRQIGEAVARWTLIGDAARASLSAALAVTDEQVAGRHSSMMAEHCWNAAGSALEAASLASAPAKPMRAEAEAYADALCERSGIDMDDWDSFKADLENTLIEFAENHPAPPVGVKSSTGMFKRVPGRIALLDGCSTECAVHELDDNLYANTGPFFRLLTPTCDGYQDSDGRAWTVHDASVPVAVKPLEWRKPDPDNIMDRDDCQIVATGLGGQYAVSHRELVRITSPDNMGFLLWDADDAFSFTEHLTVEAAKAAAQADYEARIRSAIASPAKASEAGAMQALADLAQDAVSGLRYVREHHGDLSGVGFERVFAKEAEVKSLYLNRGTGEASPAISEIAAERRRQMDVEGWTLDHDDQHDRGELARAAVCYADPLNENRERAPVKWPWSPEWWKPKDRRRDLVKAAALIVAEIERLDRSHGAIGETALPPEQYRGTGEASSAERELEELAQRTDELAGCREALKQSVIEVAKLEKVRHDLNEMVLRYMARAEASEASKRRMEEALQKIAHQKKTDELETEYDVEVASFEDGYDLCIDEARAALSDSLASPEEPRP